MPLRSARMLVPAVLAIAIAGCDDLAIDPAALAPDGASASRALMAGGSGVDEPVWITTGHVERNCRVRTTTFDLVKLDPVDGRVLLRAPLPAHADAFDVDPRTGDVWIASGDAVVRRYDRRGNIRMEKAYNGFLQVVTVDPRTRNAWVGGAFGLEQLDRSGAVTATAPDARVPHFEGWVNPSSGIYSVIDVHQFSSQGTKDILHVGPDGATVSRTVTGDVGAGVHTRPSAVGVAGDPTTGLVYAVSPFGDGHLWKIDPQSGGILDARAHAGASAVTFAPDGTVWVGSRAFDGGGGLGRYDTDLNLLGTVPGIDRVGIQGLAADSRGNVWAVDEASGDRKLVKYDAEGNELLTVLATDVVLHRPEGGFLRGVRVGPGPIGPRPPGCDDRGQGSCEPDVELTTCHGFPSIIVKEVTTTFEIRVRNIGNGATEPFELIDVLPDGWTPISAVPAFTSTDDNTATWIVDPIPAGGSAKLRITALAGSECDIEATNTVLAPEVPGDPDLTNNSATFGPFLVRCSLPTGI